MQTQPSQQLASALKPRLSMIDKWSGLDWEHHDGVEYRTSLDLFTLMFPRIFHLTRLILSFTPCGYVNTTEVLTWFLTCIGVQLGCKTGMFSTETSEPLLHSSHSLYSHSESKFLPTACSNHANFLAHHITSLKKIYEEFNKCLRVIKTSTWNVP